MKKSTLITVIATVLILFAFHETGWGQVNIIAGSTVTQDFSIGTSATATMPSGWKVDKNTTVRTVGTYSAAVTATERSGGNDMSTSAANGIYNFAAGDPTTSTERAVGGLSSSSASKSVNVYVQLTNNGSTGINDFTISYAVEKYRKGLNSAGFSIQMYYSTDGSSWTSAGSNFLTSFAADADNTGYNPAPGVTTNVSSQTLSVSLAASASLYLAWNYSVTSGTTTSNAQALGIDDVSITANGTATGPTWTSGYPKAEDATSNAFTAKVNINVAGTAYLVVLSSGATAPTSAQVKAGQDASGSPVLSNMKATIACAAGNTEYTSIISGLSNSTTYDVYFVAEDVSSNLQASPVKVTVTTLASAVAPTITSPTVASITNNSALLGGDVTSDGGSTITARGVVWSQTSLNNNPLIGGANVTDVPGTGTLGVFTVTAGSLPAKTNISFKAYATNTIGTSYTTVTTFYTLADEPTTHAGSFTATAASQTQIDLTWTAATGADGYIILIKQGTTAPTGTPADATGYSVGNTIGNGTVAAIVTSGATTSQPINGLSASTQYYFTIMPYAWDGANYQTYNYYTAATIPSATATTQSPPAATYTWTGDTDFDWTVESNWDPYRSSLANNDILIFDNGYTITVTSVPTQTIGQLHVTNGTKLSLQAGSAATLTLFGDSGTDLELTAGSELNLNGTSAVVIALSASATASISGNMTFASSAHKLIGQAASAITFNNGAVFTSGTGFSSNAFGSSTSTPVAVANSVLFASGSTYVFISGSNPFALTAPASVVVFQTGSLYKQSSTSTPSFSGRTYADFEYDLNNKSLTVTGASAVQIDNLKITNGKFYFNMTATPGHTIKGNIIVDDTLGFNPASAGTVVLGGSAAQTISGSGALTFGTLSTIKINNAAGIVLGRDVALDSLEFQSGVISTGTHTLSTTSSPSGAGAGAYVNGNLQIAVPLTATALNFTIGDAASYTPVAVAFTGIATAGSMLAYTTPGLHPDAASSGIDNAKCVNRYWTITNNGAAFTSCDATFTFVPGDILGGADPAAFLVMKWDPSIWSGTTLGTRTTTTTQVTGITSFSDFMIGELQSSVPRILSVSGTVEGGNANCYNATDTITVAGGSSTFEIQANGAATMKAGVAVIYLPGTWVHPGGYMLGTIVTDDHYCNGKAPERPLAQEETGVDLIDNSFRIYPNPTTGMFTIEQRGELSSNPVKVDILSTLGGKILSTELMGRRQDLSIKGNTPGIYFVKVTAGAKVQTVKIILTN